MPKHDSFWVVYDREAESKYPKQLHQKAYQMAEAQGINVAFSNVCFEVWLLLHFVNSSASYSCFDNLMLESPLKKQLESRGIRKYEKGASNLFKIFEKSEVDDARRRAESMNKAALQTCDKPNSPPYLINPYTNVHLLLDSIDEFVEENCK